MLSTTSASSFKQTLLTLVPWSYGHRAAHYIVTQKADAESDDSAVQLSKGKREGKKASPALLKTEVKVLQNFTMAFWEVLQQQKQITEKRWETAGIE